MNKIFQIPPPGRRQSMFCGDIMDFSLRVEPVITGQAWLRTNLGRDGLRRIEIIHETRKHRRRQARDWRDIPMIAGAAGEWNLSLPLLEPGHFEAKAYFLPENKSVPIWPAGANFVVNVHPARQSCATLIYNAFVRQFGRQIHPDAIVSRAEQARLAHSGYTIIPPSGTFRDLTRELDFIITRLGCRVLMLMPIHPTPTVFGRMGVYGSPYAALDFFDVDPALAEFDPRSTPFDQFQELVDAVHARRAQLWLDVAVNHTGWASKIHTLYPEWLARQSDGRIRSPGAWGTTWEDLTELDHNHRELWDYLAEVFLFWCRHGVDGFRCDAAYMVPVPAWEYMLARVRDEFPETFFLLEGLGGDIKTTAALMNVANLNGAYSELFQNYDRAALENYLPVSARLAEADGLMVHFAETHDNNRLAARSPEYARMRTALSALLSHNGAFAFANGVEWLATEKIDVHGRSSLNWGAADNQVDWIRRLHSLLRNHPAYFPGVEGRFVHREGGNAIAFLRQPADQGRALLVLANLDDHDRQSLAWSRDDFDFKSEAAVDLLSGLPVRAPADGVLLRLNLDPAQVLCLAQTPAEFEQLTAIENLPCSDPGRIVTQRLRAKAMDLICAFRGYGDIKEHDCERASADLARDPSTFCRSLATDHIDCITHWNPMRDCRREVMLPAGHCLVTIMGYPFRLRLTVQKRVLFQEDALPASDGRYFTVLPPQAVDKVRETELSAEVFAADGVRHDTGPLLLLPPGDQIQAPSCLRKQVHAGRRMFLAVNGRGGMIRTALDWGRIYSKYDALLAANLHPRHPVDRWIMLVRCRAWLECHGYSRELGPDSFMHFQQVDNAGCWHFRVSFGDVGHVEVDLIARMPRDENAVELVFRRRASVEVKNSLPDNLPVCLILRPDIEDRNFHEDTLAYSGPETAWPAAVEALSDGFVFTPHPERRLEVRLASGRYFPSSEWQYMVYHEVEAERGLRPHSDLFSPGYFRTDLKAERVARLTAGTPALPKSGWMSESFLEIAANKTSVRPLVTELKSAMSQFLARRDNLLTVIAGYPWFLDWGRDTLICARGMIAAGMMEEVRRIVLQFATFEKDGTLPNMLDGGAAANRDTSDAPLWLVAACADWCRAAGDYSLLSAKAGKRTLRSVLDSIIGHYQSGTSNGIRMDVGSGLIFSPSHFTWMDTNYPAATPRSGYPVEIQALWWAALDFMAEAARSDEYRELSQKVRSEFENLFWRPELGFLCDCRHADSADVSAAAAAADDALRPNQLLAITLGLVEKPDIASAVLSSAMELIVPGAIRSLADRSVEFPLPVFLDGRQLNDPQNPYWHQYEGDEDTRRKPAYHNGTAWTWLFPSFSEAWFKRYGEAGRIAAHSWLAGGVSRLIDQGCIGQLPEILDGNYPHALRGCDAQAWGVTEAFRVLQMLDPQTLRSSQKL